MKVKQEIFEIKGAPLEGLNPLPKFRSRKPQEHKTSDRFPAYLKEDLGTYTKVLPYLMQDRYSRKREVLKLKSFVLENAYLKARFLPEYGGRLHELYDKVHKQQLLFVNPVIQPGNLAIRNAWLSGGIEWNIGNLGHCATTCDNVFAAILEDGEGNEFLRIYEFERLKSIFWQVDFHLPEDSPYLQVHVKMINPFDEDTTTYWWSNVAVPELGDTRVLSSGKQVISFTDGKCDFERLPYIDAMPGNDITYPRNATRSFDYFIQENDPNACTWEAAAYQNGVVFYERSTAPLYYKKLFCWGNHHAGKHWQEYLSDGEGTGYYAELQAGIAPSQLHDKKMPANSKYEWTQCFGGVKLQPQKLYDENFDAACDYFDDHLNTFLTAEKITALNEKLALFADIPVAPKNIVHSGSGFGALEAVRMQIDGDGAVPASMYFPVETIGTTEMRWLELLQQGYLSAEDVRVIPDSYMIGKRWKKYLEEAANGAYKNWNALLHYGVMMYEIGDHTRVANKVYDEAQDALQIQAARDAWKESIALDENIWAYRNLAVLESNEGNTELAESYYDRAVELEGAYDDYALVSEYLAFLLKQKNYRKVWDNFIHLPEHCRAVDRIRITAAVAAVKLDELAYLEQFFSEEHYDIREGENSLTDVWFEYCAHRMAKERGITELTDEVLQDLMDEAWDIYPPDPSIDFRMSFDKKTRYRV